MQLTDLYRQMTAGDMGRQAFYSGYRRHDNPFPLNTLEARQWELSWATAEKEEAFQLQYQAASLAFQFQHKLSQSTKIWESTIHNIKREMFYWKAPNQIRVYFVRSSTPDGQQRLDITAIKP